MISLKMKLATLKGFQNKNNAIISCLPYVIGRCRSADFIIAHVNVSRNHCEIFKENTLWKIKDYSSSGTYVNGSLVGKGESEILNDGDSIRFGPAESNLNWTFYSYNSSNANSNDSDVKRNSRMGLDLFNKDYDVIRSNCTDNEVNFQKDFENNKSNEDHFDSTFTMDLNLEKVNQNREIWKTAKELHDGNNECSHSLREDYFKEKIHELTKELQQVQSAFVDLEGKNSVPQEEVVGGTICNTEPTVTTNLLENLTDLMEAEFQCTICSELFVVAVTLNCTHTFCKYCINQWKKKQKTCPICRKKIVNETRSLVVDNYIDKMVGNLSFELKKRREDIVKERSGIEQCKKRSKQKNKNL